MPDDEWIKELEDGRKVKFTCQELPENSAFITAQIEGNEVVYERLLAPIRILIADDYRDWRNQTRLLLQARPEWQIVCEVSDGAEAVRKAEELQPELILLDIGLPNLNGIEAARRIRQLSPNSKIVFVSMDNSLDVVQVALSTGAYGYAYKARAESELLPAIDTVLRGEQFVANVLKGFKVTDMKEAKAPHRHEVLFHSDASPE